MRSCAFAFVLLAACGPSGDPLTIHYTFSAGPEQACLDQAGDPVRDCNDVAMTCDSVALLRIVDPEDANHIYLEQCGSIPNDRNPHNLCTIKQAITPNGTFPTTRVEIQLAVYPRSELPEDLQHNPICPSHVEFTASQVAAPTNDPQPALAGVAYSDGYDSEITIELGCNDTGLIDTEECRDQSALDISASVLDFDQQFSVSAALASDLAVRVGAPTLENTHWTFLNASTAEILLESTTPEPTWAADNLNIDNLTDYLCIQVLEVGRATPAITCLPVTAPVPHAFDLVGMRVEQATVDAVLDALGATEFPNGLVIGMVVNGGDPVPGATVLDGAGSDIQYLSADRMSLGGTMTSSSGIFVSSNAPLEFGGGANHWTATADMQTQRNDPIGGLIDHRLMVVVIQLDPAF